MYRKQQGLIESGMSVVPLDAPSPPLSGWEAVTDDNIKTIAPRIPIVTSGVHAVLLYTLMCAQNNLYRYLFYYLFCYQSLFTH